MFTNAISILIVLIILSSIFSGNFKAYSWKSYEEWDISSPLLKMNTNCMVLLDLLNGQLRIENTLYHYQLLGHLKKLS